MVGYVKEVIQIVLKAPWGNTRNCYAAHTYMQVAGWGTRLQKPTRLYQQWQKSGCAGPARCNSRWHVCKAAPWPRGACTPVLGSRSTILVLGPQPRKCSGWYSLWSPSCVLRTQTWTQTLGCHTLQNSVGVNETSRQDGASRARRKGDWSTALDPTTVPQRFLKLKAAHNTLPPMAMSLLFRGPNRQRWAGHLTRLMTFSD